MVAARRQHTGRRRGGRHPVRVNTRVPARRPSMAWPVPQGPVRNFARVAPDSQPPSWGRPSSWEVRCTSLGFRTNPNPNKEFGTNNTNDSSVQWGWRVGSQKRLFGCCGSDSRQHRARVSTRHPQPPAIPYLPGQTVPRPPFLGIKLSCKVEIRCSLLASEASDAKKFLRRRLPKST